MAVCVRVSLDPFFGGDDKIKLSFNLWTMSCAWTTSIGYREWFAFTSPQSNSKRIIKTEYYSPIASSLRCGCDQERPNSILFQFYDARRTKWQKNWIENLERAGSRGEGLRIRTLKVPKASRNKKKKAGRSVHLVPRQSHFFWDLIPAYLKFAWEKKQVPPSTGENPISRRARESSWRLPSDCNGWNAFHRLIADYRIHQAIEVFSRVVGEYDNRGKHMFTIIAMSHSSPKTLLSVIVFKVMCLSVRHSST